jgi:hypothetical protein
MVAAAQTGSLAFFAHRTRGASGIGPARDAPNTPSAGTGSASVSLSRRMCANGGSDVW